MSEQIAPHVHFQYSSVRHQAETAVSGMWLFLATEVLFFGGLILGWIYCRHWQQGGFDAGGRETVLWIGTVNLFIVVASTAIYSAGLAFIEMGNVKRLITCCWITAAFGLLFIILKITEWEIDISEHLFPAMTDFKITGEEEGGARLFWSFYFVSTALHAVHMAAGVGAVSWIALRARRKEFSAAWYTPVEVTGLYWSFVDIVWIVLYPLIYLIGRGTS